MFKKLEKSFSESEEPFPESEEQLSRSRKSRFPEAKESSRKLEESMENLSIATFFILNSCIFETFSVYLHQNVSNVTQR